MYQSRGYGHDIRSNPRKHPLLPQVAALIHIRYSKLYVHCPGVDDLDIRVAPEDAGRAVSIMQVDINDQSPPGGRLDPLMAMAMLLKQHIPGRLAEHGGREGAAKLRPARPPEPALPQHGSPAPERHGS